MGLLSFQVCSFRMLLNGYFELIKPKKISNSYPNEKIYINTYSSNYEADAKKSSHMFKKKMDDSTILQRIGRRQWCLLTKNNSNQGI